MGTSEPLFIPAGTVFSADDITHWAHRDRRDLEAAIAEADVLVTAPHAGAAIPEELAPFLAEGFTRRLQFDYTDCSTSPIVRRWAEIDPRIVVVENPHPRLVRDPNREKPADLRAGFAEALRRVREAGAWNRVDLTGVDAIRPVTFSFFPMLRVPADDAELERMVDAFADVAAQGLEVYERTRDDLVRRFIEAKLETASREGQASFTLYAFHDTMNRTTRPDGAIAVDRAPDDRLPAVVALSNRGDHDGETRLADDGSLLVSDPATMSPPLIRLLADAHRRGFDVAHPDAVTLNRPYLGSFEILNAGRTFRGVAAEAAEARVLLGAVQGEFRREYLLGEANTATLTAPGTGWIEPDAARADAVARASKRSWDVYRREVAAN